MADVKWIKLATNIFDNRKIRQIECLPEGYAIIVVWVKLLCLAGNINDSGYVYFTKEIPYTDQMIAQQFNVPLTTVQLAFKVFEQFGMIDVIDNILHISNWEKYQSVDRLAEIREYNRLAKQKSRERQKMLPPVNDMSMTSQRCHETDIDKDKEKDKELDKELYVSIVSHLNEKAGTKYKATTSKTKQVINGRLSEGFKLEDFITVIDKKCDEWLGDEKMEKFLRPETLFGTKFESYLNQKQSKPQTGRKEIVPKWMQKKDTQPSAESIRESCEMMDRIMEEMKQKELAERAERLKQELGGF